MLLSIRVNLGAVADLLIDRGHLAQWDAEDRGKVRDALEAALRTWASYQTT